MSFHLKSLSTIKLFRKYFVQHRWGDDNNIEISDTEISKLMYPIENKIADIVRDALYNRKFKIDIDESWGEISVSNMLQFEEVVAKEIFDLITQHVSKT
jgi:hypothetical protein